MLACVHGEELVVVLARERALAAQERAHVPLGRGAAEVTGEVALGLVATREESAQRVAAEAHARAGEDGRAPPSAAPRSFGSRSACRWEVGQQQLSADRSSAELSGIMRMNCWRDGGFEWSAFISLSSAWCRRQRLSL